MVFPEFVDTLIHAAKDPDEKKSTIPEIPMRKIYLYYVYMYRAVSGKKTTAFKCS